MYILGQLRSVDIRLPIFSLVMGNRVDRATSTAGKNTRNYNSRYTRYQRQRSIGPRVSLEFRDDLRCSIDRSFPPGCLFVIECACFIHSFYEKTRRGEDRRLQRRALYEPRNTLFKRSGCGRGFASKRRSTTRSSPLPTRTFIEIREFLPFPYSCFSPSTVFLRKTHFEKV